MPAPDTNFASSVARNNAAAATSSGSPMRPIGALASQYFTEIRVVEERLRQRSPDRARLQVVDRDLVLAEIDRHAFRQAGDRVLRSAVSREARTRRVRHDRAEVDDAAAAARTCMYGTAAFETRKIAVTLIPRIRSHCSSEVSSNCAPIAMPALLTRMSRPPNAFSARLRSGSRAHLLPSRPAPTLTTAALPLKCACQSRPGKSTAEHAARHSRRRHRRLRDRCRCRRR